MIQREGRLGGNEKIGALGIFRKTYDKRNDGLTKNDHFLAMLNRAKTRGFAPCYVLFDGWYSSLENLKAVRGHGWFWLTRLKANRQVNLDRQGRRAVNATAITASGTTVYLQGFGLILVFEIVAPDGDIAYWASNDLSMTELSRLQNAELSWAIENYHRGLEQCCGVDQARARAARAQRNQIGMSIRAFLRFEYHFYTTGVSWYEAKTQIIREAVRSYIANLLYKIPSLYSPTP